MDIKRAKKEIKDSIEAYLAKDEYGDYMIPSIRQRPILLMGPPGIGKTQVMEQVAKECKVALVSYTITHHTRQSAVGLPFIEKKMYDGKEYSVTEYTMSEIIASVYDKMEETGLREGILFIDEINCSNDICGDNQNVRIHSGGHLRIKGDLTDHAGGRKHAKFARIQAEQRYLPSLLGEKIGANFTGKDEQHSKAFVVAAVYERALFIMTDKGTSAQRFLLLFGQG